MPFRRALALITAALNLPFGYTLAIWSSAMIATDRFGTPSPVEVVTFLFGAIGAYLLLASISTRYLGPSTPVRMRKATLVNFFAVAAAAAVSIVVQFLPVAIAGFFVAGFTGTATYMLALAGLLWFTAWRTVQRWTASHDTLQI
jgi:hypothetical protein